MLRGGHSTRVACPVRIVRCEPSSVSSGSSSCQTALGSRRPEESVKKVDNTLCRDGPRQPAARASIARSAGASSEEKIASKARNELVAQWKVRTKSSTAHKEPGLSHDPWRRRPTERPYVGLRAHLDARQQQQRPTEETKVGRRRARTPTARSSLTDETRAPAATGAAAANLASTRDTSPSTCPRTRLGLARRSPTRARSRWSSTN